MTNFMAELGEGGSRNQWMGKQNRERVGTCGASEGRSLWVPNLPSSLDLGEGSSSTPSGLKVKEKQPSDLFAPSFPESLWWCEGQEP